MVRALRAAAEKERGSGGQPGSSERRAIQAEDSEQSPRGRTPGPSEGQERAPEKGAQEARVGKVRQRGGPDHLPLHSPRVGVPAAQRLTCTLKASLSRTENRLHGRRGGGRAAGKPRQLIQARDGDGSDDEEGSSGQTLGMFILKAGLKECVDRTAVAGERREI